MDSKARSRAQARVCGLSAHVSTTFLHGVPKSKENLPCCGCHSVPGKSSLEPCSWVQAMKWEREIEARNRALSDEELDAMMPTEGYKILEPPPGYAPIRTPARKLMATPTPLGGTPGYAIPEENRGQSFDVPQELEGLPELKPEDHQYFGKLLKDVSCLTHDPLLM